MAGRLGMLEDKHLEAVLVLTPDHCLHAMTMAAFEADRHVLCEKPLATTVAEAEEIFDIAESITSFCG